VKLRGRFTLTLALAALAPITVAAVVTSQVVSSSMRQDYQVIRTNAEAGIEHAIAQSKKQLTDAADSLANKNHPLVGGLLTEMRVGTDCSLRVDALNDLRRQAGPIMTGLSLQTLTITDPLDNNKVLVSPHNPGQHSQPNREVAAQADDSKGQTFFSNDKFRNGAVVETVLVTKAARTVRDGSCKVVVSVGRRLDHDLFVPVHTNRVDTRIVTPTNTVVLPPTVADWNTFAKDPPIRVPLLGPDDQPVAYVEVAVSDGNLDALVLSVALISAGLAVAALLVVVLIGLLVARRTARDLDRLVEGSMAASRGDLDYRVPVRSNDEVGAVANAFNFMMEDLRASKERLVIAERIAAWQEIARRLAHEIKNPLTPIQMAMDTLRKTWKKKHPSFDEILEESTTTVLQEADRLKKIVAEFSDFARMPKPELSRVDLNELIRSALALYQGAIRVDMNLTPTVPPLDADKNQLNQVLLNLVENARDAIGSRADGHITVSTKLGDASDRVLLIVEDNGPGVPGDLRDKVFAPYFTTKHAKGGTGLGLAIVHRIVSDHGGRIFVTDVPGGGARFAIELPLRNGTALLASRI